MLRIVFSLLLFAVPALADEYLVQIDAKAAIARSEAECVRRGCDGVLTKYWWGAVENPISKEAAIVVQPGTPYGNAGLTPPEKSDASATKTLPAEWYKTDSKSGQSALVTVDPKAF